MSSNHIFTRPKVRAALIKTICGAIMAIAVSACAYTSTDSTDAGATTGATRQLAKELLGVNTSNGLKEQLLEYHGMNVSFNSDLHIPNWVAWELTRDEVNGKVGRYNKFSSDENVDGCATTTDYKNSGYDRGHMAPAGDMKWSQQAMEESFLLTNVCPQSHALNSGSWKGLEEKCRNWAMADSAIFIVCGPILTPKPTEYIGDSQVAVPEGFFKVIISPYANPPRGIGFIMPNSKVPGGMQKASVSIDEVERITGHDFFAALPDSIEDIIESQNNFHQWSRIR